MRRALIGGAVAVLLMLGSAGTAVAARNPSGTGQPGAECGDEGATSEPAGFSTAGFENAEAHYAGSDGTASLHSGNSARRLAVRRCLLPGDERRALSPTEHQLRSRPSSDGRDLIGEPRGVL